MIIKTFTDESSVAALKRVRKEMGGDAIVLKTRQVTGRDLKPVFEVTACLESASVAKTSEILGDFAKETTTPAVEKKPVRKEEPTTPKTEQEPVRSSDDLDRRIASIDRKLNQLISLGIQPDGVTKLEMFQALHRMLKQADLPDDYLEQFISGLVESYDGATDIATYARTALAMEIKDMIADEIKFKIGDKAIFIGPAGGGKSSAMGKLAASLTARQKQKVKLLSLDDYKMAAFDEICSYAEILGIEVIPPPSANNATTPDETAVTLIDAPAMPAKPDQLANLKQKINSVDPDYRFAVFSCLTRSRDVFEISRMLKELEPTHLILTMQDLSSCLGTFVTAAKATGLRVVFMSDSPGGMGELIRPDAELLATKLLNSEVRGD